MRRKFGRILSALLSGVMLVSLLLGIPAAAGESDVPVVSPGLSVLAARTDVAVFGMKGNDIVFSKDLFARGMNLSDIGYLTVRSLPAVTDGELLLGSSRVAAGQVISGAHLENLTFHPATDDLTHSAFTFAVNGSGAEMTCSLWVLSEKNYTPTVSMAPVLSLKRSTYRGLAAYGTLSAYDPDGDEMVFEIVSYPENGSLELTDAKQGSYVYRPYSTYLGNDSFSYVARDRYGNYSAAAEVRLTVERCGTSVTYADMEGSADECAALNVTEKSVMSGTQVGDKYYFYPDRTVSRADFLVMVMQAAGITAVPACDRTVFADDAEIPASMKGYVTAAYRLGYITGSQKDGQLCFLPNEDLTRAQAAVIIERIIEPGKPTVIPTFTDQGEIPVWAADAIYSLSAAGILCSTGGQIAPTEKVTRAQTAQMLTSLMAYREN